jgi:branched-subunit amino acid transport protein
MTTYSLLIILGCGLVTWLPRVVPFILVKKIQLPDIILRFLYYVPICILTALFVSNLLIVKEGKFPELNMTYGLATIPTAIVAFLTKNLMYIVISGMCFMAIIRHFCI